MGDCSCIKGEANFNFILKSISKEVMLFQDLSEWMDDPQYKALDKYSIKVSIPGGKEAEIEIDLQKFNKISSKELLGEEGLSIPDGVYCFTLTNCGYTYQRYAAITRQLECCTNNLYIKGEDTSRIDGLIKEIKNAAEFQNDDIANELYSEALKLAELRNCSC